MHVVVCIYVYVCVCICCCVQCARDPHCIILRAIQCTRKGTFTHFRDQATQNAAAVTPVTLNETLLYTLHPTPYTLNPKPYTLNPTPYTLHPTPCTYTLYPKIKTQTLECPSEKVGLFCLFAWQEVVRGGRV